VNVPQERAAGRRLGAIWIAAVIVLLDQATKAIVRQRFELHESVAVVPNFFDLTRVHNTGAAFGMLNNVDFPFKSVVLVLVAFAALAGVALYGAMLPPAQWLARLGLAFILGGAAGNLIDRVALGYVVDFFDFYWRDWHFWAFNVADAAITVGVGLMILDLLGLGTRVSRTV
jgi:signal peptidase II